jgi:5'(3')-deoxyribonucleotidase
MTTTIAIDFDDVLMPLLPVLVDYYNNKERTGDEPIAHVDNFETYNYEQGFGIPYNRVRSIFHNFTHSEEFKQLHVTAPSEDCITALEALSKTHKLIVISARENRLQECTEEYLSKFLPNLFDSVHLCNSYGEGTKKTKLQLMQETGATVLIDDNPTYIKQAISDGRTGILLGTGRWTLCGKEQLMNEKLVSYAPCWKYVNRLILKRPVEVDKIYDYMNRTFEKCTNRSEICFAYGYLYGTNMQLIRDLSPVLVKDTCYERVRISIKTENMIVELQEDCLYHRHEFKFDE